MNVLITGVAGFAGSHLVEYLVRRNHADDTFGRGGGITIYGADRFNCRMDNIRHLTHLFTFDQFDLMDRSSVARVIDRSQPDIVFHLAAQSFVPTSWFAPADTFAVNVTGQVNLFESIRDAGLSPVIHVACSSEEYGLVHPDECPITERNELRPMSPYAVSKIAQDFMGFQYWKSYGMKIVRTRAFNHTGPRRGEQFVTSTFAKQIAEAEIGIRPPRIDVGNLDAERDFTDVRDMVRAYWLAATMGEPGAVYNVCSGNRIRIGDMLATLIGHSTLADQFQLCHDLARRRPSDVPLLMGDYTAFRVQTGWGPSVPFDRTMRDLLEYWRGVVRVIITSKNPHGGVQ